MENVVISHLTTADTVWLLLRSTKCFTKVNIKLTIGLVIYILVTLFFKMRHIMPIQAFRYISRHNRSIIQNRSVTGSTDFQTVCGQELPQIYGERPGKSDQYSYCNDTSFLHNPLDPFKHNSSQ